MHRGIDRASRRRRTATRGWCCLAAGALAAAAQCGCGRYWVCEATDEPATDAIPATLAATGLLAADGALGEGVVAYKPQFELWSDGAEKQRWIRLPPATRIDTSDMDAWTQAVLEQVHHQVEGATRYQPTHLSRVLRFQRACELARRAEAPDWPQLALECGYFDQSHLINEVREFTGTTPVGLSRATRQFEDLHVIDPAGSHSSKTPAGARP